MMLKEFSDSMRFHKVRNIRYGQERLDWLGVRGIFNMVGILDYMGPDVVRGFCTGCLDPMTSEVAIIESSLKDSGKGNPLKVVSVMVFRDRFAYGLFMLRDGLDHPRYFDGNGFAEPVLGLLN